LAKQVMRQTAAEHEYLHKDFHGALSAAIDYLEARHGAEAVREYLRQFARTYYAPLTEAIRRLGLGPLRDHVASLYRIEGGQAAIEATADEMVVHVAACPAVAHMRARVYPVARLFRETTRTVNEAICEGTPFQAELVEYDERTGRCVQRFSRRGGA